MDNKNIIFQSVDSWKKMPLDYSTMNHRGYFSKNQVQEIDIADDEEIPTDAEETPEEVPTEETPTDTAEPATDEMPTDEEYMGDDDMGGGDMGGMGGGAEESQDLEINPDNLSRMYALKNIHNKLIFLEDYLSTIYDDELQDIKNVLLQAINMFAIIVNNLKAYEKKIDEIIKIYYKLITTLFSNLINYLKKKRRAK